MSPDSWPRQQNFEPSIGTGRIFLRADRRGSRRHRSRGDHTRSGWYRDGVHHGDDPSRVGAGKRGRRATRWRSLLCRRWCRRLRGLATAWGRFPQGCIWIISGQKPESATIRPVATVKRYAVKEDLSERHSYSQLRPKVARTSSLAEASTPSSADCVCLQLMSVEVHR